MLGRWFKGPNPEELIRDADVAFDGGDYANARHLYDRAIGKLAEWSDEAERVRARRSACLDRLAERRIAAAESFRSAGANEEAIAELEAVLEMTSDASIAERARNLRDDIVQQTSGPIAPTEVELGPEERFEVLAASWDDAQDQEYRTYGPDFREGILALNDGDGVRARTLLEEVMRNAASARYLWFEVARARVLAGDAIEAREAFLRFLEELRPEEGGEARLHAHFELARLADEAADPEFALQQYQLAMELYPDQPAPYVVLGRFLRKHGHVEQAVQVLEAAVSLVSDARPEWQVFHELGLARRDAGQEAAAIETFEHVIRWLMTRFRAAPPAETAEVLAGLHEKHGRLERAADLYRLLAEGGDPARRPDYAIELSRVLRALGLADEARHALERALPSADAVGQAALRQALEQQP